jgi:hypothetical protein
VSTRAAQIADDIARVISTDDNLTDVLAALHQVQVYAISQLCESCRQRALGAILQQLPAAVASEPPPRRCQHARRH